MPLSETPCLDVQSARTPSREQEDEAERLFALSEQLFEQARMLDPLSPRAGVGSPLRTSPVPPLQLQGLGMHGMAEELFQQAKKLDTRGVDDTKIGEVSTGLASDIFQEARKHDSVSTGFEGDANEEEAASLYLSAADLGHAPSNCNLGLMYEEGRGVRQDTAEAMRRYHLAKEQGDIKVHSGASICNSHK